MFSAYLDNLTAIIKIIVPEIDPKIRIKCDVFCQSPGVTIRRVHYAVSVANNIQGVPGRNVPYLGRMFLKLKYTDINKNTYIRSWKVAAAAWHAAAHRLPAHHNNRIPYAVNISVSRS